MCSGKKGKKALVGLSGGVDSSLAALLLLEQGYEVIGVTMAVYGGPAGALPAPGGSACYGCDEGEDIAAAARLAGMLGIEHHVFDCVREYKEAVLDYFRAAYLAGRTPNPCVRCNHLLKFGLLPRLAQERGVEYDYFATGHYARVEYAPERACWLLRRGADQAKDQSYFLYRLSQEQLGRAVFPLGGMTKKEARALAAQKNLPMHDKPDSQDFYAGDHAELLGMADRPGDIVDAEGKVLGRHGGHWHFTPGQRKGLGLAAPAPLYVRRVDAARNEVVVAPYAQSLSGGCAVGDLRLHAPWALDDPALRARLRSSQPPVPALARLEERDGTMRVEFEHPQSGVAPGQSLVLYLGDVVVGGGVIMDWAETPYRHSGC
ncbi:MAG: tRNA 2-thiouridine(34) synthase MnmA [Deltaproteobacteria bacterium]|jgi:tRNA-specific 2-thiouridylase|nr:tRNA 2-thiouridine(34) synthase MnmA [Deltaproteobacteria bacterium]